MELRTGAMFSSYAQCTDALLNITLSLYSLDTYNVVEPCDTWQQVLQNTLNYTVPDGNFADAVSDGSLAAVRPASLSDDAVATNLDIAFFLFLYFTIFIAYSQGIHNLE